MLDIYAATFSAQCIQAAGGISVSYSTELIYGENLNEAHANRFGMITCKERFPPEDGFSCHQCQLKKVPEVLELDKGEKRKRYRVVVLEVDG